MVLTYSPLCDTDLSAYLAYCFSSVTNGRIIGHDSGDGGSDGVQGRECGSVDDGGSSGDLVAGCYRTGCSWMDALVAFGCDGRVDRNVGSSVRSSGEPVEGLSSDSTCVGVCDFGGASGCSAGSGDGGYKKTESVVVEGVSTGDSSLPVRGVDGVGSAAEFVSARTLENRWRRKEKKARKKVRQELGEDWRKREVRTFPKEVSGSWVARKNAENVLGEARAKRQLQLLEARDVEEDKKKQRAKVLEATERSKVSIEKAYMSLKATGNVAKLPGGGFAETVVSDGVIEGVPGLSPGSGSISPDSSASQHEFRLAQKTILDLEKKNKDLEKRIERIAQYENFNCGREVVFSVHEDANTYHVSPSVAEVLREATGYAAVEHYIDEDILAGVVVRRVHDVGSYSDC